MKNDLFQKVIEGISLKSRLSMVGNTSAYFYFLHNFISIIVKTTLTIMAPATPPIIMPRLVVDYSSGSSSYSAIARNENYMLLSANFYIWKVSVVFATVEEKRPHLMFRREVSPWKP